MKILVVEDDRETGDYVRSGLEEHGHVVDLAVDGRDGLFLAAGESYDAAVIDRMLPKLDGLGLVRTLRTAGIRTPVLFLTTRSAVGDRVEGLEAGADDYLIKPFAFAELLARLNALMRRPPLSLQETILVSGELAMDLLARRVTRRGREVELQPREFRLLEYLMRNTGRLSTRTMLLENVWHFHFEPRTNIVETHVSRLRSKLNRGFDRDVIQTVRGSGYVLCADAH